MNVFWAAFGGGAAAGVVTLLAVVLGEYIRWKLAQPKLVVSVSLGRLYNMNDDAPKVFFDAKNPRIAPITVTSFGYVVRTRERPKAVVQPPPHYTFPYEITTGKSISPWLDTRELINHLLESDLTASDIKYAWFDTAAGKQFRGKLRKETVKALNEFLRQQLQP